MVTIFLCLYCKSTVYIGPVYPPYTHGFGGTIGLGEFEVYYEFPMITNPRFRLTQYDGKYIQVTI